MTTDSRNEAREEKDRLAKALIKIGPMISSSVLAYLSFLIKENAGMEGAILAIKEQSEFSEDEKEELIKILDSDSLELSIIAQSYAKQSLKEMVLDSRVHQLDADYFTPEKVSKIVLEMTDHDNCKKVMNYDSRRGDFLLETRKALPEAALHGFEPSKNALMISKIRSLVSNSNISFSLGEWMEEMNPDEQYDLIFCDSFNAVPEPRLKSRFDDLSSKLNIPSRRIGFDWMISSLLLPYLEEGGKLFKVCAGSPLWNIPESGLRETYVKRGWIESVIRLPKRSYLPRTNVDTYLIMIGENQSNSVRMIDLAGKEDERGLDELDLENLHRLLDNDAKENGKEIPVEEIISNNSNLLPEKYLYPISIPENAVPLKSVARKFIRGAQISVSALKDLTTDKKTDLVMLKSSSIQNGQIDYDNVDYLEECPERFEKAAVASSDMIVTRIGNPFKTAIVINPVDLTLILGGNLFAFKPDTSRIDPWFLQAYFESSQGKAALDDLSNGDLKSISLPVLKDLLVPCPPMDKQKKIAEEYKKVSNRLIETQKTLEKLKQDLRDVYTKGGV